MTTQNHNYHDDVLFVPCEWSDGSVEQQPVRKLNCNLFIDSRPPARLTRIGTELGLATWLQDLYLTNLGLDSLPDELSALTRLGILALESNAFRRVPACVPRLTTLQTLSLSDNPLEELPVELGNLQELMFLRVASCAHLHWLPSSVARLTRLYSLWADKEALAWLPSTMRSMTSLEHFYFKGPGELSATDIAKLNEVLDNCHARERALMSELAIGLAPLSLPVLLMTLIWERVHGARMPDAAGWFVSEQRRWRVFQAVHKAAIKEQ